MTFTYIARTPDGATHTAITADEFDALLDALLARWPGQDIELDAVVVDENAPAVLGTTATTTAK